MQFLEVLLDGIILVVLFNGANGTIYKHFMSQLTSHYFIISTLALSL